MGHIRRAASPRCTHLSNTLTAMTSVLPQIIFTTQAIDDLIRLRAFLATRNPAAAEKAKNTLLESLNGLKQFPLANRPVPNLAFTHDLVIKFGTNGYIARYRYEPLGDVTILRIRHQRECGFDDGL
jgi:plasmid stabilization system protein ParE